MLQRNTQMVFDFFYLMFIFTGAEAVAFDFFWDKLLNRSKGK